MRTSRSLHVTALLTCVFAVVVLGVGERDGMLPVLAVVFCGAGFVLKEFYGKHLNTFWGNLVALAALVVALWNFEIAQTELRLIAMANLLVYAQFVLFFRERSPHTYWMMLLLSLLQVCVASVLINHFYLAFLLIVYMLLASRMVIQLTYRRECFEATRGKPLRRRVKKAQNANNLVSEPLPAFAETASGQERLRWVLATQPAEFSARLSRKAERNEYHGFQKHWAWLCFLTLVLVPVIFTILPRPYADAGFVAGDAAGLNSVGFSEEVALGEFGISLENTEEVMRVSFRTPTGTPVQLQGGQSPLLRGVSYSQYENRKWKRAGSGRNNLLRRLDRDVPTAQYLIQEVTIVPDNHRYLFGVYPVYHAYGEDNHDNVKWDAGHRAMVREDDNSRQLVYTTRTTGILNGRLKEFIEIQNGDTPTLGELLEYPSEELPRLKAAADAVIAAMPSDGSSDNIAKSRALVRYLKDSGQFRYTLQAPDRDRSIDPIEDFIANNPQGHCEYFATALTLMLRSQGIPARMVNGYKGGDWNTLGQFYQVRQLHAHVWVEAMVDDPDYTGSGTPPKKWMVLDPTPAAAVQASMWSNFRQFSDYIQHMWSSYVLGMNKDNQSEDVYSEIFNAAAWRDFIDEIKLAISGEWTVAGFFNLRLIVTLMILPLFLYGTIRLFINTVRWLRARGSESRKQRYAAKAQVEFYRRFEKIMAERRILREEAQTQREFAMAIGGQLSADSATRVLAAIPKFVVDAFYRVRFGAKQLAPAEATKLNQELDRIELALAKANGQHPPTNGHPPPA